MTKTIFIPSGPIEWASSRFRMHWVAKYSDDMEVLDFLEKGELEKADNIIWGKRVDYDYVKDHPNQRHFWDMCDPLWWYSPHSSVIIADTFDGFVFSTPGLREDWVQWSKTDRKKSHVIPDRFDLTEFTGSHLFSSYDFPKKFVWYGIFQNRPSVVGHIDMLNRLVASGTAVTLTIMDDKPEIPLFQHTMFPVEYVKWDLGIEKKVIQSADFALCGRYPGPWGKLKSDNKATLAELLGVISITDYEYFYFSRLMEKDSGYLQDMAKKAQRFVKEVYDVKLSASDWERVLNDKE